MKKRCLCFILVVLTLFATTVTASAYDFDDYISVIGFDEKVDYTAKIMDCLNEGGEHSMFAGAIYERQRNLKIETLNLNYEMTNYFDQYETAAEILEAMNHEPDEEDDVVTYSEDDLYWLSRVVFAEAGCDWFPDWVQQDVASVVLNRVSDPRYPNTIKGVIFDPGQYSCVDSGSIYNSPTQKVINNCKYVLENGSTLPSGVIGQSSYAWGTVYKTYYDSVLGTTIKFFYA